MRSALLVSPNFLERFVAIECAGVGTLVDDEHGRQNLLRRILGTRNFSGQVSELVRARRFPDLILISIGQNNVDWAWRCPPHNSTHRSSDYNG